MFYSSPHKICKIYKELLDNVMSIQKGAFALQCLIIICAMAPIYMRHGAYFMRHSAYHFSLGKKRYLGNKKRTFL